MIITKRAIQKNVTAILLFSFFLCGCDTFFSPAPQPVYTRLSGHSCKSIIDKDDADEIPYLLCPGVSGYKLAERTDDVGRDSIKIIDPAHHTFLLNYPIIANTPQLFVDDRVEWRMVATNAKQTPIALITRVNVHNDNEANSDDPSKVTSTYLAIAKITSSKVCVTDIILEGTQPMEEIRKEADLAQNKRCIPQPSQP